MAADQQSDLAQAIQEVTQRAELLVREEIALAKTEMVEKGTKLAKGAVAGIVAGVFAVFSLIYLLYALSWALWEIIGVGRGPWLGFLITGVVILLLGGILAFIAFRWVKRGSPPTPQMAIEEAQLIKETVTSSRPAETSPAIRPNEEVDR